MKLDPSEYCFSPGDMVEFVNIPHYQYRLGEQEMALIIEGPVHHHDCIKHKAFVLKWNMITDITTAMTEGNEVVLKFWAKL